MNITEFVITGLNWNELSLDSAGFHKAGIFEQNREDNQNDCINTAAISK